MDYKKHSIFPEVIIFIPKVFSDERGYFFESYNKTISSILKVQFLQENHSKSKKYETTITLFNFCSIYSK
jgi:dTDP-4-dehydrorhamnose 3,5-epimerase-like enzyme